MPYEKKDMLGVIERFLNMDEQDQMVYIIGRRLGLFDKIDDMNDPVQSRGARSTLERLKVKNTDELHQVIQQVMARYI